MSTPIYTSYGPDGANTLQYYGDFWRGNVERGGYVLQSDDEAILNLNSSLNPGDGIGSFTHYSGFGAKCKVEFISKSGETLHSFKSDFGEELLFNFLIGYIP